MSHNGILFYKQGWVHRYLRSLDQNAQEKNAKEYGIMFKFYILQLVILIPAAAALPGFHMPWLKNRRRECLWEGEPSAKTGRQPVMCSQFQPALGKPPPH